MTMDIKNYYLGKSFEDPKNYQYVYIPINFIPQEVINELIMMDIVHWGYLHIEFCKDVYGLSEAGYISNKQIQKFLAPHVY